MKTEPTKIDREAACLFTPAPGVRMWCELEYRIAPMRYVGRNPINLNQWAFDESMICAVVEVLASMFRVAAIDTDDPATVGVMLAQLQAKDPNSWCLEWPPDVAALVAAMRAVMGVP